MVIKRYLKKDQPTVDLFRLQKEIWFNGKFGLLFPQNFLN